MPVHRLHSCYYYATMQWSHYFYSRFLLSESDCTLLEFIFWLFYPRLGLCTYCAYCIIKWTDGLFGLKPIVPVISFQVKSSDLSLACAWLIPVVCVGLIKHALNRPRWRKQYWTLRLKWLEMHKPKSDIIQTWVSMPFGDSHYSLLLRKAFFLRKTLGLCVPRGQFWKFRASLMM